MGTPTHGTVLILEVLAKHGPLPKRWIVPKLREPLAASTVSYYIYRLLRQGKIRVQGRVQVVGCSAHGWAPGINVYEIVEAAT